jgi:uncharacterized membrane protein
MIMKRDVHELSQRLLNKDFDDLPSQQQHVLHLNKHAFDPFPYILLNLVLSMMAGIQAPIIMMSQNRQTQKDRLDATHDYEVNLKAELEIMSLHQKLDALREHQWEELIEMQKEQIRLLNLMIEGLRGVKSEGK